GEHCDVLAALSLAERQTRVLKHNDAFAVFDLHGDIQHPQYESCGLFHRGTRHLSRWVLRLNQKRPLLLSSTVKDEGDALIVDFTNPAPDNGAPGGAPAESLHVQRRCFIWNGILYERISVVNYARHRVQGTIAIQF